MNTFDIITIIVLLFALYRGYVQGLSVQLSGLVGIVAGSYLAYRFADTVATWFNLQPDFGRIVAFICIFIAVIVGMALVGRLIKGMFKITGLGLLDQLSGAVLSVLKYALVISIVLSGINSLNNTMEFMPKNELKKSYCYTPLMKLSSAVFPYIDFFRDNIKGNNAK